MLQEPVACLGYSVMPSRIKVHNPYPGNKLRQAADKAYRRSKGTNASRGYDATWRRIRLLVLADEPLCRLCAAKGKHTVARHVDHIDGDSWNRANSNLQPLCIACHNAKTADDLARMRNKKVLGANS